MMLLSLGKWKTMVCCSVYHKPKKDYTSYYMKIPLCLHSLKAFEHNRNAEI